MQRKYPSPTQHHEQHTLPLYIVDILQRNSTTARQLKISPAAVGCLTVFIMGLKLPASPAFFPTAWMQTAWPQTLLINTLHLQGLLPFLHQGRPCQQSPSQRKAAAGVRAKSGTFDCIFSACMLSIPKGSAREDKAGQFWPRKAQAYSRYHRYGRLSGINAHKYKLCHHWHLLVLISANIFNNWPLRSAVFSVLLCVCGVADHLLLQLCRAELSAQTRRHTSIVHNVILNQQLWYVY